MKFAFPSREFDDAVAAVCDGSLSEEQARALNELLRSDPTARDEYILRVELHSRLATEPDFFASTGDEPGKSRAPRCGTGSPLEVLQFQPAERARNRKLRWALALAACVALLATGLWGLRLWRSGERQGTTSEAVAMLNRVVDAQWDEREETLRLGAPLEAGRLRLKSGLAQVVFYSGARVVIEGPTDLQIISPTEASCSMGRLTAEVPAQARGFRIGTPQLTVADPEAVFGLNVSTRETELHVFEGNVRFQPDGNAESQDLSEGAGVVVEHSLPPRFISARSGGFTSLFDLRAKSVAATATRCDQWRSTSRRLNQDPSLLVHFEFEHETSSDWQLLNTGLRGADMPKATIVGCRWTHGRWLTKPALEFHSVNDRVRLSVPGEMDALTLTAWVRVQGLDRKLNSLFMCDGFEPGTVHWLIRNDGVLGLTIVGAASDSYQLVTSPSVITLDKFGMWLHLAVVLDGTAGRVAHYVNGLPVSEKTLRIKPPYRIGAAELGNWNAKGFPKNDPFMIRNFSGIMDEFCLFRRALSAVQIRALYTDGKPQPEPMAKR